MTEMFETNTDEMLEFVFWKPMRGDITMWMRIMGNRRKWAENFMTSGNGLICARKNGKELRRKTKTALRRCE